jgi:anaerobic selenocysteine-containing dehydrogenase
MTISTDRRLLMLELKPTSNGGFIVEISPEEAQRRGLKAGDKIEILQIADPAQVQAIAEQVMQEYRDTLEFLKDK